MRYIISFILAISICIAGVAVSTADSSKTSQVTITLQNSLSMEFYNDPNVLYSNVIPFTNVDPTKTVAYPDGRKENDGKSDTAVVCKSNVGGVWYLKLNVIANMPLTADRIRCFIDQPWNRNTGQRADGSLSQTPQWYPLSDKPETVYTAGLQDKSNLPFGTLTSFNFALNPSGLEANQTYSAQIVYTLSTSP